MLLTEKKFMTGYFRINFSIVLISALILSFNFNCSNQREIRSNNTDSRVIEKGDYATKSNFECNQSEPVEVINVSKIPREIKKPKPHYPKAAAGFKTEAVVIVKVLLDEKGKPQKAEIVKCDTKQFKEDFKKAALKAIFKARWSPAYLNNKPVKCWIQYIIRFTP